MGSSADAGKLLAEAGVCPSLAGEDSVGMHAHLEERHAGDCQERQQAGSHEDG